MVVSNGAVLHSVQGLRILAVAEIRGRLSHLNELAKEHNASVIIHSGNFGFFDLDSISKINHRTLRHISMFSPLLDASKLPQDSQELKDGLARDALSELPHFLSGKFKLNVPVYCIYGSSEDVSVIEKFNDGSYSVNNLYLIDETKTYALETPSGHIVRLMGLGGSLVLHRFFDNGDGDSTIAGTHGLMWTTALQIGQLIQTVRKTFDPSEIRIFISHPCPSKDALLLALAISLRADFTMSSGLHFIYGSSYNAFTTEPTFESFKKNLVSARAQFMDIWENVKVQVMNLLEKDAKQRVLLQSALDVFERMPADVNGDNAGNDYLSAAYRNMWNFNLCDSEYGSLVLNIVEGKVGIESKSKGFDFRYRKPKKGKGTTTPTPTTATPVPIRPLTAAVAGARANNSNTTYKDKSNSNATSSAPAGSTNASSTNTTNGTTTTSNSKSNEPNTTTTNLNNFPTAPTTATTTTSTASTTSDETAPPRPGIWISNGNASIDEIKSFFTESDRESITDVEIKESYTHPNKKFALVHFTTAEQTKTAIENMDKEKSGRVSIIGDRSNAPLRRGSHFFRGSSRGGRGGIGGPSSSSRGRSRPGPPPQQK